MQIEEKVHHGGCDVVVSSRMLRHYIFSIYISLYLKKTYFSYLPNLVCSSLYIKSNIRKLNHNSKPMNLNKMNLLQYIGEPSEKHVHSRVYELQDSSSTAVSVCNELPCHLISLILVKLPIEMIIRCKCVCKDWRRLILDPYFIKLYAQISPYDLLWNYGVLKTILDFY